MTEQRRQDCWGVVMRVSSQKHPTFLKHQIGVMQTVGAMAIFIPLLLITGDRQTQAAPFTGKIAQITDDLRPYAQNGGISQRQIDHLNRSYAKRQSYKAIQTLRRRGELGSPNYVSEFREVYEIRGGDRYHAPQKFHILYRLSPSCNYRCSEAYDWYKQ